MENFKYIVKNASPIRYDNIVEDGTGAVYFVVPEVLVSKILNRMFGKSKEGWFKQGFVHATSLPFIGAFANPVLGGKPHAKMRDPYMDQIKTGFVALPGFWLAQYICESTTGKLFHMPKFDIRDFLIFALSKVITRPLVSSLSGVVGEGFIRATHDQTSRRFDEQSQKSNISYKG